MPTHAADQKARDVPICLSDHLPGSTGYSRKHLICLALAAIAKMLYSGSVSHGTFISIAEKSKMKMLVGLLPRLPMATFANPHMRELVLSLSVKRHFSILKTLSKPNHSSKNLPLHAITMGAGLQDMNGRHKQTFSPWHPKVDAHPENYPAGHSAV